ncbi:methyl-accepting chemotaxis protein [Ramlibacter sp.]|uniref:methyl-accepting chemotaxis protein n=1 Tax=Ramlibacter sp. TaxID=1917967 RepID=UPI002B6BC94B|nr:methyl-accepting chemotaxis protein [Ramlibacter sp.]HWI80410.1 methyl-accepting chemotaxis protein [Ramlibacter sp.]
MKLWQKIALGPLVAITFLLALGGLSYAVLTKQAQTIEGMYQQRFADYRKATQASQAITEVHSNVYRLLTWISNLQPEQIQQTTAAQKRRIDEAIGTVQHFARSAGSAEERRLAGVLAGKLAKYEDNVVKGIDLSTVDVSMGTMLLQNADGIFQEMLKEFGAIVEIERRAAEASYLEAEAAFRQALIVLVAMIVVAVAVSAAAAVVMTRLIVRPLKAATAYAGQIAGGDLTGTIHATSTDETGDLVRSLAEMNAGLAAIVGKVRAGTDSISSASSQIASGNQDLSQRTEEQASSLQETAASMEQLTGTVKQNADNARQANQLAASASQVAAKGGAVVKDVVDTMASIAASSGKIFDITSVIDGIAFQTNILALNAAVEAARAGEQGRGFAVVAAEVRSLAQRSAAAAKEIKTLIDDSTGKVDAGTRLVGAAGQTMTEVVASIRRVSEIMGEIASASQEQTRGIEQVNAAITQMDQVTQQNATLVEQASSAAQSMQLQAGSLVEAVSAFRLAEAQAAEAIARAQEAAPRPAPRAGQEAPDGTRGEWATF